MKMITTVLKILQGLLISFDRFIFDGVFFSSTVQRVHRTNEPTNDDDDDDTDNRPFTLNDGDELSDDEQLDDNEHETISNQHIHDNFKVDNERGKKRNLFIFYNYYLYFITFRNETNQMGT